jgi:glycerol-3-phosphate dehydrogenase
VKRDLNLLTNKTFDLVVIGAGIFGVCTAWDAALRGLSVALVEKKDFSHATSANHLKVVHGGIRYLQHGDIYRIRESSRERSALLRIAPHLAKPLPIVIPTYGHGKKGKELLKAGMLVYDLLTWDRNRGLHYEQKIPGGSLLGREEVYELFSGLEKNGLTGGAVFYDGQMTNPPRLALSFLRSAVNAGAEVANYVEAKEFLWQGNQVTGIVAQDGMTGDTLNIKGKLVVNAAGPWAAHLLDGEKELRKNLQPVFSRDLSFVVKKRFKHSYGLAVPTVAKDADAVFDRGGRHLFFAPWRDYTLVGVWHKIIEGPPEKITVSPEELNSFTEEVNTCYPAMNISPGDIVRVNTGLTLYGEKEKQGEISLSFGKRSLLIDHEKDHNINGLVTLVGVRSTTARGMAEKTVDLVVQKVLGKSVACSTETTPIFGGDMIRLKDLVDDAIKTRPREIEPEHMTALVGNHGTHYQDVLQTVSDRQELLQSFKGSSVIKAEVLHAIRKEMAVHLSDVVFRRTDLATGALPDRDVLRECGLLMAAELGWSEDRLEQEIDDVEKAPPQFS